MNELFLQKIKEKLNPPIDKISINNFENRINEKLPADYYIFLTQICNGYADDSNGGIFNFKKAIEYCHLFYSEDYIENISFDDCFYEFPIKTKDAEKYIIDVEEFNNYYTPAFTIKNISGVLYLSHEGMDNYYILVIKGEQKGTIWFLNESRELNPIYNHNTLKQFTFSDWIDCFFINKNIIKTNSQLKSVEYYYKNLNSIPEEVFKHTTLKKLVFFGNKIKKLPKELFDLQSLKILVLSKNELMEIPSEISKLKNLIYLDISDNSNLKTIAEELSELINLKELKINNSNDLQSIPLMIGKLINLRFLEISNTQVTSLPESVGNLINLSQFNFCGNNSIKKIPDEFCNLISLKNLFMYSLKNLEYLPENFGNLMSLETLYLSENVKISCLPESFGNLTNLKYLSLRDTKLKRLPQSFDNLHNLTSLELNIKGDFDYDDAFKKLSKLKKLTYLSVYCNENISQSIGLLTNLTTLQIAKNESVFVHNKIILPESFSQLKLTHLYFYEKNVFLPNDLGNLKYLEILQLNQFSINSVKPRLKEFTNLKELSCFNLTNNEINELKKILPNCRVH